MKITLADLCVHVAHYTPLRERRARLERNLAGIGVSASWFTDYDRERLTPETWERYYRRDDDLWHQKTKTHTFVPARAIRSAELSLAIKHVEIYRHIRDHGEPWALVLEDDVLLAPDFGGRFDEYFADAPDDFDFIFLGSGCNLRISDPSPDRRFYPKEPPVAKCTDSYLLTRTAAQRLLTSIVPVTLPIDFELSYQMQLHGMKVYWLEPPLITQGSQNGTYESAVQ